MKTDQGMNHL